MRQNQNDEYRTFRVNSFFSYIPVISKELGYKKTGKFRVKTKNSGSVLEAGLEPARPRGHRILSPACLPIPPLERDFKSKIKPSKHLFRRF